MGVRAPRMVILLASVAAFIVLGQAVLGGLTAAFDLASVRSVAGWHGSFLDPVMRTVTELGGGIGLSFLTVVALAVAAALRRWRSAIFLGLVFARRGYRIRRVEGDVPAPTTADRFSGRTRTPRLRADRPKRTSDKEAVRAHPAPPGPFRWLRAPGRG